MEWRNPGERGREFLKKYRMVILVVLSGLLLMMIPEKQETTGVSLQETVNSPSQDLQQSLQEILSMIQGAGKVAVLLTEKNGAETIYQMDTDRSGGAERENQKRSTVITANASREENGLVRQINPPVLQGAVVVCQGGDDPKVKLAIVDAVMGATGLPSNCISVLKMK